MLVLTTAFALLASTAATPPKQNVMPQLIEEATEEDLLTETESMDYDEIVFDDEVNELNDDLESEE